MVQIFRPSANKFSLLTLLITILTLLLLAVSAYAYFQSSYHTSVGVIREQPVAFSHKHHVKGLGLDCRFCHNAREEKQAEESSAGKHSQSIEPFFPTRPALEQSLIRA